MEKILEKIKKGEEISEDDISSQVFTWEEYIGGLDLGHWSFTDINLEYRNDVVVVSDDVVLFPVLPTYIIEDVNTSVMYVGRYVIISWDNFRGDITIVDDSQGYASPIQYLILGREQYFWVPIVGNPMPLQEALAFAEAIAK